MTAEAAFSVGSGNLNDSPQIIATSLGISLLSYYCGSRKTVIGAEGSEKTGGKSRSASTESVQFGDAEQRLLTVALPCGLLSAPETAPSAQQLCALFKAPSSKRERQVVFFGHFIIMSSSYNQSGREAFFLSFQ